MEWWKTLDHLELKLSLFSLSRMPIVFYLWVFEGFLKFNFRWTEIYASREDLIRENYIKFLSYPSRWFCFFNGLLAFMQCAMFICGLTFDICIIHVGTGTSFIKDFSVQRNIRKNEEHFECPDTLQTCSCWGCTKTFCIPLQNHLWYASKIGLSTEWYFSSKDAFHSHLSCLPHQHKRPDMQAISLLPFSSPQVIVRDQKHNRRQFLCSNHFLVSEIITLKKKKIYQKLMVKKCRGG